MGYCTVTDFTSLLVSSFPMLMWNQTFSSAEYISGACFGSHKITSGVPHQDHAYRFNVSRTVVSRIIVSCLTVTDVTLSPLISWPDREQPQRTMPRCFSDSFGLKTSVIIDCFEVFIDRPSNLLARAQTFSNYTIKVLIGITPQGTILFVSKAWGGRTSDKFLKFPYLSQGWFFGLNPPTHS